MSLSSVCSLSASSASLLSLSLSALLPLPLSLPLSGYPGYRSPPATTLTTDSTEPSVPTSFLSGFSLFALFFYLFLAVSPPRFALLPCLLNVPLFVTNSALTREIRAKSARAAAANPLSLCAVSSFSRVSARALSLPRVIDTSPTQNTRHLAPSPSLPLFSKSGHTLIPFLPPTHQRSPSRSGVQSRHNLSKTPRHEVSTPPALLPPVPRGRTHNKLLGVPYLSQSG
ncbi:hypothetical protein M427DRAFT_36124 [Gonapodya prolifera JEL478]|uniref:Uncharacterized protein n=1 Tax=Gonapodya prolifera (strain JEL478) TaxID=1344416 RepID=A0A139A3H9_GONPJ|nr:hypothetical protein M427DRAFT_36124 [Gonapodya prolifera JEL478]|eukprot:KXS11219.1 hypothetical protein M427DRAFT_36124 [Gonapodya prolifera JEL478]